MSLVEKLSERPVAADPAGREADFAFAYGLLRQDVRPEAEAFSRALFEKGFDDPSLRILTLDDAPVGFFSIAAGADEVQLRHLYVDPAFQGQGIGHAIMDRALETAHEQKLPLVAVVPDRNRAVDVLLRAGFNLCGSGERYFGDAAGDCVRTLELRSRETEKYMPSMRFYEPPPQLPAARPRPF